MRSEKYAVGSAAAAAGAAVVGDIVTGDKKKVRVANVIALLLKNQPLCHILFVFLSYSGLLARAMPARQVLNLAYSPPVERRALQPRRLSLGSGTRPGVRYRLLACQSLAVNAKELSCFRIIKPINSLDVLGQEI